MSWEWIPYSDGSHHFNPDNDFDVSMLWFNAGKPSNPEDAGESPFLCTDGGNENMKNMDWFPGEPFLRLGSGWYLHLNKDITFTAPDGVIYDRVGVQLVARTAGNWPASVLAKDVFTPAEAVQVLCEYCTPLLGVPCAVLDGFSAFACDCYVDDVPTWDDINDAWLLARDSYQDAD